MIEILFSDPRTHASNKSILEELKRSEIHSILSKGYNLYAINVFTLVRHRMKRDRVILVKSKYKTTKEVEDLYIDSVRNSRWKCVRDRVTNGEIYCTAHKLNIE